MSVAMVVVFGSIVIAMVAVSTMWRSGSTAQAAVRFEVRLAENQAAAGLDAARVAPSRVIYLHRDAIVTNADIATSRVVPGATPSQFWIDVRLNDAGAQKMRQATTSHIGKPVAIIIDGDVVSAPTVKSPIGGSAVISGDYTRADADRIAQGMNPNR
jgi:preprotein translocase subunit SecD